MGEPSDGDGLSGSKRNVRLKVVMHAGKQFAWKVGAQAEIQYIGAAMRGSAAFLGSAPAGGLQPRHVCIFSQQTLNPAAPHCSPRIAGGSECGVANRAFFLHGQVFHT